MTSNLINVDGVDFMDEKQQKEVGESSPFFVGCHSFLHTIFLDLYTHNKYNVCMNLIRESEGIHEEES